MIQTNSILFFDDAGFRKNIALSSPEDIVNFITGRIKAYPNWGFFRQSPKNPKQYHALLWNKEIKDIEITRLQGKEIITLGYGRELAKELLKEGVL